MVWPYTGGDIAAMEDMESVRYGPVVHFPTKTMGIDLLAVNAEHSVAKLGSCAGPYPAPILALLDIRPESFLHGHRAMRTARPRTEPSKAAPDFGGNREEFFTAAFADARGILTWHGSLDLSCRARSVTAESGISVPFIPIIL